MLDDVNVLCVNYRQLFTELTRYLARRTNDPELAQDIAQEAFVSVLSSRDGFDWERPLWPWLKVTATRLLIGHARKSGREYVCEPEDWEAESPLAIEDELLLAEAISKVPKRQRIALSLRYLEGWTQADAASFMGVTRPAFKQLLIRARGRLRLEYGRLSRGVSGLLPVRLFRKSGSGEQVRTGELLKPFAHIGADAASQVLSGLLALVLASGSAASSTPAFKESETASVRSTRDARAPDAPPAASNQTHDGRKQTSGNIGSPANEGDSTNDPVDDLTDPNKKVREPEDATIVSVVFGSDEEEGRAGFASGLSNCRVQPCPPVLFRTDDGGASWTRLPAEGLTGVWLDVPPAFGVSHERIFAMGATGLQVSNDGGRSFEVAATAGAAFARGAMAISPSFHDGDPTILIGAQALMRYDDTARTIHPEPAIALRGPFEPVFAPEHPHDDRILLGGLEPSATGFRSAVFVCTRSLCESIPIPGESLIPKLLPGSSFLHDGALYAYTSNGLYSRLPGERGFEGMPGPWSGILEDVKLLRGQRLVAAVAPHESEITSKTGLFTSGDGGRSWKRVNSPLLRKGASALALSGNHLLAALSGRGVACSADGGRTWARRC